MADNEDVLPSRLPVTRLALGAVSAFVAAANRYAEIVHGLGPRRWRVTPARVAASFLGDRVMRLDGRAVPGFAPLSGFFETADGWLRTHANYPHHRARLLAALALPEDADRDRLARALAGMPAAEAEDRIVGAGGIAARMRDPGEWSASPAGRALADRPLVSVAVRGEGPEWAPGPRRGRAGLDLLRGLRVLDLTRVLAGPVATRSLALLGAEVLRVDPPALPELDAVHWDTGAGKRTALLDLGRPEDLARLRELLADADVLVTGYRPGALDRFGLAGEGLPPGVLHASVSAWGAEGPWAGRRGFDSVVQAATGIAVREAEDGGRGGMPGALPAQALDHASGYFLAAGILDALALRSRDGRGRDVAVSLARTAGWLLARPSQPRLPAAPVDPAALVTHSQGGHRVTTARPAVSDADDYPYPARPWGRDRAEWAGAAPR